jgi:hypothetical protein
MAFTLMDIVANANEAKFVVGLGTKLRKCTRKHRFTELFVCFIDFVER